MEEFGRFVYGIYKRQNWKDREGMEDSLKNQDSVFTFEKCVLSNLGQAPLDFTLCCRLWAEECCKEDGCFRVTWLFKIICVVLKEMPPGPFVYRDMI